jgi:outer membrane protein TolC
MTGSKEPPMSVDAPQVTEPMGDADALVGKAEEGHRGFNAKKLNVELKDKQLSAAWMKFVPHLEAGWGMNYFFTQPSSLQDQERARWAFLVSLKWPIFTMQSLGAVKVAQADMRKARFELEDAERKLAWDVRQARRDYIAALSSVQIADKWSKLANDGLRLIRASFEVGTSSSLDVTDAQRTASMAAVNLGAKRLDAQIALMKLLRAMGDDIPSALKAEGTALMPVAPPADSSVR